MKYVASFRMTEQINEDEWQTATRTKICDETTTLEEIIKWQHKVSHRPNSSYENLSVEISTPEQEAK